METQLLLAAPEDHIFQAEPDGLGIGVEVTLDGMMYEREEAEEIADMICRVVSAWWRRREVENNNPKMYGYKVC